MHTSELSEKFKFFIGKTVHTQAVNSMRGQTGHNNPPYDLDDNHNLKLFKRIRSLAHKFNAELVVEGLPYQDHARCKVHVRTTPNDDGRLTIIGFDAFVGSPS